MTENIRDTLESLREEDYRSFVIKLTPDIDKNSVLGVRAPALRKLAKELYRNDSYRDFIHDLPHKYHEENNLHAYIIGEMKDYNEIISELEHFLPYVGNWATCDSLRPRIKKTDLSRFLDCINIWLTSHKTYTVRFAIEMLMVHFLGEKFRITYAEKAAAVRSDEYYVNMMIAWYFATALSTNPSEIMPFFENKLLSPWVHNKAIQKALESFRVSSELKSELRKLKIR